MRRESLRPADDLVDELVDTVCADRGLGAGDRVVVLVNGTGATPPMELSIVLRRWPRAPRASAGSSSSAAGSGTFLSSIDMAGVSVALLAVDDERLALLDAPARSAAWPSGSGRLAGPGADAPVPTVDAPGRGAGVRARRAGDGARAPASRRCAARCARPSTHLTELDAATGDGDLGTSLTRGADAVLDALDDYGPRRPGRHPARPSPRPCAAPSAGPPDPLSATGAAARRRAPGRRRRRVDGAARRGRRDRPTSAAPARGDRTLLDALLPRRRRPRRLGVDGRRVGAAAAGREATAQMSPRRGRSSYLGERVHGHRDAGAEAVVVVLKALRPGA